MSILSRKLDLNNFETLGLKMTAITIEIDVMGLWRAKINQNWETLMDYIGMQPQHIELYLGEHRIRSLDGFENLCISVRVKKNPIKKCIKSNNHKALERWLVAGYPLGDEKWLFQALSPQIATVLITFGAKPEPWVVPDGPEPRWKETKFESRQAKYPATCLMEIILVRIALSDGTRLGCQSYPPRCFINHLKTVKVLLEAEPETKDFREFIKSFNSPLADEILELLAL